MQPPHQVFLTTIRPQAACSLLLQPIRFLSYKILSKTYSLMQPSVPACHLVTCWLPPLLALQQPQRQEGGGVQHGQVGGQRAHALAKGAAEPKVC